MSTLVLDSSSDLPQSSEPCGSCTNRYPGVAAWTSSVLSPGAQEELYDGRDIHVDTRLRGLHGLAQDDIVEEQGPGWGPFFKFLLITTTVGYFVRGVGWQQWGFPEFGDPDGIRADIIVPAAVGGIVATLVR